MILFVFEGEMQRNLNQSERQGCCFSEGNIQSSVAEVRVAVGMRPRSVFGGADYQLVIK